jgi:hypothetical protein
VKKPSYNPEARSTLWKQRFSVAESNQEQQNKRFAEWYDAFNARVDNKQAPWRSKPYLPLIAQQIWALVAKFSAMRPGFEAKVRNEDVDEADLNKKAEAISKKLEFDYDSPYMDEPMRDKLAAVILDAAVTGTGMAKVVWKTKKIVYRERIVDDKGYADLTKEKVVEKIVGYNDFEPVNIFNVFVSPSTDRLNKGWIVIRDFIPLADLQKTNDAKGGKFYQNLDKLSGDPEYGNFNDYNRSRNRLTTNEDVADKTMDIATIYECYEGDKICVYGVSKKGDDKNAWVLLRESTNYYWHNKWPLAKFHVKKRPFSFWGQGLAELAYRLQIIYNDVFAHYLDSQNLINNPSFWMPENGEVDDYIVEPGALIRYRGQAPPTPIQHAQLDNSGLELIFSMLNQAVEGVTASQYATGMPNSATDKTQGTATGIMRLQEAAGDIVAYMRENIINSVVQVGKMWHSNNQQFMQAPVAVVTNDKGKRTVSNISPSDIQGEADIYVDSASMLPKSDEEKQQTALALNQTLANLQDRSLQQAQFAGTSPLYINYNEMAESTADALGVNNTQSLLMTEEQVQKEQVDKQKKMMEEEERAAMGYSPDANEATSQMMEELTQAGMLNEEDMTDGEDQSGIRASA